MPFKPRIGRWGQADSESLASKPRWSGKLSAQWKTLSLGRKAENNRGRHWMPALASAYVIIGIYTLMCMYHIMHTSRTHHIYTSYTHTHHNHISHTLYSHITLTHHTHNTHITHITHFTLTHHTPHTHFTLIHHTPHTHFTLTHHIPHTHHTDSSLSLSHTHTHAHTHTHTHTSFIVELWRRQLVCYEVQLFLCTTTSLISPSHPFC